MPLGSPVRVFRIMILMFAFLLPVVLSGQLASKTKKAVRTAPAARRVTPARITPERTLRLSQRMQAGKSLVVLKNDRQLLPVGRLDTLKTVVVTLGLEKENLFPRFVARYLPVEEKVIDPRAGQETIGRQLDSLAGFNLAVLVLADRYNPGDTTVTVQKQWAALAGKLDSLRAKNGIKVAGLVLDTLISTIVPGCLSRIDALVATDHLDYDRLDLASQLMFGAIPATGKLGTDLGTYRTGEGIGFPASGRLAYALPEEAGIDSLCLAHTIDSLVAIGLDAKAFPGCQLLLAQKGKVIYRKSYGYHTYAPLQPVQDDDLYDLASVTKVLAPVPALMMLADQKKFVVSKKMSDYWPDWKGSNKEGILVSDLLSHQARLRPGVILWPKTMDHSSGCKPEYYSSQPSAGRDLRVSENLYIINSFPDSVYKAIRNSTLLKSKRYAYSDLGFVILPKVIENLSGEDYQAFLRNRLYARLGASTLRFLPYPAVPKEKIVPTEDDRVFRQELLQGFVHDETAALMGGVSGNAGLFGSAGDVAKVMQLYLQNGTYGNERFISSETLLNWTSSHFQKTNNRRGFGFDKPGIQVSHHAGKERYPSASVSEQSYGHSGYTGTFVWADPAKALLLVFLSNRVFPDRNNHKINTLKIRPALLDTFIRLVP